MAETTVKGKPIQLLSFLKNYGAESNLHIGLNTSTLFDIWGGSFIKSRGWAGKKYPQGVWVLNGGNFPIMALAGGSNTQKTGKVVKDSSAILYRFSKSTVLYGDMESTLDIKRFANNVDELYGIDGYFEENIENIRFIYMPNSAGVDGTVLHNRMKEIYSEITNLKNSTNKEDIALYQSLQLETPFYSEKTGKNIMMMQPIIFIDDSISETKFDRLAFKQFEEGDMDEGGKKRTRDMEIGNLRRILMEDTCNLGPRVGLRSYWVAQTGDKISMDGRPTEKDSTFVRHGKKVSAPKAILKLPHIGIEIIKGSVLKNKDHTLYYPRKKTNVSNDGKLNPDLMEYTTNIFRNKVGSSGVGIGFIGSQTEGIKDGLSMYHVLKSAGRYGLPGNDTRHACALLPDLTLMRTTINDLIDENPKLERALGICYHLWYCNTFWDDHPEEFRISPEELYELIKEQGHDWDELLDTIDFWHDNHEFIKKPTLTLYELLEIAVNKKPIYWKTK